MKISWMVFGWWPVLLGPAAMAAVYLAYVTDNLPFVSRGANENIALVLLGTVVAGYTVLYCFNRRVFCYVNLPMEAQLHVPLEETVETTAHLMMIIACIIAWITCRSERIGVSQKSADSSSE